MIKSTKKYLSLSVFYFVLTISLLVLIFKFGITGAVVISSFLQKKNPVVNTPDLYETIIQSPELFPVPEATNSSSLAISGYSLPNQKVDIYLNDLNIKSFDVDSEGKFAGFVSLSLGSSKIYAITVNSKNIQSSPSKSWTVFYNNSPPYLEILEPANNTIIEGKQNTVTIKGKISPPSRAFVNDHQMIIENEGIFNYTATLQTGENKFKIVCLDPAENKTELEWLINYQQ